MKLPEPLGVITGKLGEHCSFKSNVLRKGDGVYSEAQLREALASNEAVMRKVLELLGPQAPECCGCAAEWNEAIKAMEGALGT